MRHINATGKITHGYVATNFPVVSQRQHPYTGVVDHRLLNDVPGLENPTAEVIAAWFFERIAKCERVRIWENDDCWVDVTAQD